jgi:hypothetical protein
MITAERRNVEGHLFEIFKFCGIDHRAVAEHVKQIETMSRRQVFHFVDMNTLELILNIFINLKLIFYTFYLKKYINFPVL